MDPRDTLEEPFTTGTSLSRKVVHGGFWVFTLRIVDRIFDTIRLIVLARLLAPKDFGLLGVALLVLAILETFSQTGFDIALIQKKERVEEYLNTAWTVFIARGIVLFFILFAVSGPAASFFNTPAVVHIIMVLAATQLISGFKNIGIVYFRKELEFHKQFLYSFAQTSADLITAVIFAFILRNAWALVFGLLARYIAGFILSYVLHPYRPRIDLDWAKAKELFGFGKWATGSGILLFLIMHGDDIFVGKFLGAAMLGLYQMSYRISNMPATDITHVISQVTFPAYSKMQDDIPRLRESYFRVLRLTTFLSFPAAAMIFILAPDITRIFLGEKWMAMVPAMQILIFEGLIRSIAATTGPLFYAAGKPKIDMKWQMVRLAIIACLIYPLTVRWGIAGTSFAILVSIFIATIGFTYSGMKITRSKIKDFGRILMFPLVNVAIMISAIVILKSKIGFIKLPGFFGCVGLGALVYLCVTYLFDKYMRYGMMNSMKGLIKG